MKVSIGVLCVFFLVILVTMPRDALSAVTEALIATKLALTPPAAFAGLITGIIGTVLGAIGVKLHLVGMEEDNDGGNRKKRSLSFLQQNIQEAENQINSFIENVYRHDPSRCLDKLFCTVAYTRSKTGANLNKMEEKLLEMAARYEDGFVAKRMTASIKAGFGQSDCSVLFDSCPLDDTIMISYIDAALQKVRKESSKAEIGVEYGSQGFT